MFLNMEKPCDHLKCGPALLCLCFQVALPTGGFEAWRKMYVPYRPEKRTVTAAHSKDTFQQVLSKDIALVRVLQRHRTNEMEGSPLHSGWCLVLSPGRAVS